MTNEERDIITQFIGRVGGAQAAPQTAWGGSVPATTSPALPPVDREADALIADLFNRYPEARYRLTQLAFVQEHALTEAQNRIKRLEWEAQQAQQAAQQATQQAAQQPQGGGGFFGGLFGGGRSAPPQQPGPAWNQAAPQQNYQQAPPPPPYQQAAPQPQYAPSYQPGMFQRSGSGFLGSALTTAAGVAGGLVVGNALMDMFSPNRGLGGALGGGGGFMPATPAVESPWGSAAAAPQVDQGTWTPDPGAAASQPDQGYVDQGTWDQPSSDNSSWSDNNVDPGTDSSFDDSNNGSSDDTF